MKQQQELIKLKEILEKLMAARQKKFVKYGINFDKDYSVEIHEDQLVIKGLSMKQEQLSPPALILVGYVLGNLNINEVEKFGRCIQSSDTQGDLVITSKGTDSLKNFVFFDDAEETHKTLRTPSF